MLKISTSQIKKLSNVRGNHLVRRKRIARLSATGQTRDRTAAKITQRDAPSTQLWLSARGSALFGLTLFNALISERRSALKSGGRHREIAASHSARPRSHRMPQYHFNIMDGVEVFDSIGTKFPNDEAASVYA